MPGPGQCVGVGSWCVQRASADRNRKSAETLAAFFASILAHDAVGSTEREVWTEADGSRLGRARDLDLAIFGSALGRIRRPHVPALQRAFATSKRNPRP